MFWNKNKVTFELVLSFPLNEPFPNSELTSQNSARKLIAFINGKKVFEGKPETHLLTGAPVSVAVKSEKQKVELELKNDAGLKEKFGIDISKGKFIYVGYSSGQLAIKQESKPRGYD